MSKRHFWKKNPKKIQKNAYWEMSKRHFWKKNPDFFPGYIVMNLKFFFWEMSKRHFWKKNPTTSAC